jgi:5'-nucleotidase
MDKYHILLTNDDGIKSPGLWAAAEALSKLGFVHVTAPRDQYSGAGRSLPSNSDGSITPRTVTVNDKEWTVYAVGGSPAQTVLHGVLEITPQKPDLVVSGINYGENIGTVVTISGTVGAALEAAALGIPALAVSLETDPAHHRSYSTDVDFSAAAHFTAIFARFLLENKMPSDVDVLKVEVPMNASKDTPWKITRLSRDNYYEPIPPVRTGPYASASVRYSRMEFPDKSPGTDAYTLRVEHQVAVTPLSLDLTSRTGLQDLESLLKKSETPK